MEMHDARTPHLEKKGNGGDLSTMKQTEAQRLAAELLEESEFDIHYQAKACMLASSTELLRLDAREAQMKALNAELQAALNAIHAIAQSVPTTAAVGTAQVG